MLSFEKISLCLGSITPRRTDVGEPKLSNYHLHTLLRLWGEFKKKLSRRFSTKAFLEQYALSRNILVFDIRVLSKMAILRVCIARLWS